MTRLIYTVVVLFLMPLALLRLWWKGKRQPDYRQRWSERFGLGPRLQIRPRLWVHAVSVGETVAATPLIRAWQAAHPDWSILVTTTTPTGSAQVKRQFGESVDHCYLPFDLPWMVRTFLRRTRPNLAVLMETEIWPNLYAYAHQEQLPLLMANARLSDKSFVAYQRLNWLVAPTLRKVTLISARGREDAQRFIKLGAHSEQVEPLGNLKFDLELSPTTKINGKNWRQWLGGKHRPIWIAASTHPGEEEQVLQAHRHLLQQHPQALLILAPRHPERVASVMATVEAAGLHGIRRTAIDTPTEKTASTCPADGSVFIVDTLGELMTFYAASDVAFVGGSLVSNGGHNPLEPLTLELPVVSGSQVFNFREVYAELTTLAAVTQVTTASQLGTVIDQIFTTGWSINPATQAWLKNNQGSTQRLLERMEQLTHHA